FGDDTYGPRLYKSCDAGVGCVLRRIAEYPLPDIRRNCRGRQSEWRGGGGPLTSPPGKRPVTLPPAALPPLSSNRTARHAPNKDPHRKRARSVAPHLQRNPGVVPHRADFRWWAQVLGDQATIFSLLLTG